jgi:hypothetical protein
MSDQAQLRPADLAVGGRYLHVNRLFIRQIDSIEGDAVSYHDQYGSGRCGKRAFLRACPSVASPEDIRQAEQQLMKATRTTQTGDFTLRDEANALTAYAFRNGFLEDLHAGKPSSLLNQPGYSRITDDENRPSPRRPLQPTLYAVRARLSDANGTNRIRTGPTNPESTKGYP